MLLNSLPKDYVWHNLQVELFLNFSWRNFNAFGSPNFTMLVAIKNVMQNSAHLNRSYIALFVDKLFDEFPLQMCERKVRYISYQILDFLLDKYCSELSEKVDFVSYFTSSISGERDPRCLVLIFRLICIICDHFNSEL
ncbi:unnamed protein product [Gongylonema pulchrum]|uniref:MMS19 nucleotide excision repair protein n=1 Tax=Gongylonema pulchrum TaxID=637853 RepID=A0A3P7NF99_9BILA|nr:unnamed protein product [Gongylonema pulchrum]